MNLEKPGVGVPLGEPNSPVAAPGTIPDNGIFQGTKQGLRTAAAQVKPGVQTIQQNQQSENVPFLGQQDASEVCSHVRRLLPL